MVRVAHIVLLLCLLNSVVSAVHLVDAFGATRLHCVDCGDWLGGYFA